MDSTMADPSFETQAFGLLLVLARTAIVRPFREERPGPGGHLDRAAGRRIGCSRAARAAAEQDRDRFFIGPGWLKEPRVRITRKGSTKMSKGYHSVRRHRYRQAQAGCRD